jgi:hypothetical protein
MSDELSPNMKGCPFCGRAPGVISRATSPGETDDGDGKTIYFASCTCGGRWARAHQSGCSLAELADAWNRRAPGPATAEEARDWLVAHGQIGSALNMDAFLAEKYPGSPPRRGGEMLKCSKCDKDSGLDGEVSGRWTCGPCTESARMQDRIRRITRTHESREAVRLGKTRAVLCPGKVLPSTITDEEAQLYADENYGIEWERTSEVVIIWCQM